MRRILPLLVLLLAGGASLCLGQVAVPEIGPGSVRVYDTRPTVLPSNSIVPENPAALRWGSPSRVVVGGLRGHASTATQGASTRDDGSFSGFSLVGQAGAVAGESTHLLTQFPINGTTVPHVEKWLQSGALAFGAPETLAWGAGVTHFHADAVPGYPAAAPITQADSHGWNAGLSWRAGEHLYLGGVYGEEKGFLDGTFTGRVDRRHGALGVGLRGGGTIIWHLEADRIRYDDFLDRHGFVHLPGYGITQYTAEAMLGSWLFTYCGYTLKDSKGNAPDVQGYTADFGYSPLSGFNLTWRYEHSDGTQQGTRVTAQALNALTLAWLF